MPKGRESHVHNALDIARFGRENILNLRETRPTVAEAKTRLETWLRQKQAESVRSVLVISGRGNNSPGGVSPVREAAVRLISALRGRGIIDRYEEHTPGSFAIELASFSAGLATSKRESANDPDPQLDPHITGLDPATRILLRNLAERSLEALGIKDTAAFLEPEMQRQYSAIVSSLAAGADREHRLTIEIQRALSRIP